MKKSVLVLCTVGFVFLMVGSVLTATAPLGNPKTISNSGTIKPSPEESQSTSEPQAAESQLDKIGYLTLLVSVGFFGAAFLRGRKSSA